MAQNETKRAEIALLNARANIRITELNLEAERLKMRRLELETIVSNIEMEETKIRRLQMEGEVATQWMMLQNRQQHPDAGYAVNPQGVRQQYQGPMYAVQGGNMAGMQNIYGGNVATSGSNVRRGNMVGRWSEISYFSYPNFPIRQSLINLRHSSGHFNEQLCWSSCQPYKVKGCHNTRNSLCRLARNVNVLDIVFGSKVVIAHDLIAHGTGLGKVVQ